MKKVVEELEELDFTREANMFTGPYDVIAIAEAESIDHINNILLNDIRHNPGVRDTTTCVKIERKIVKN
ncbi:hypothetical protein AKJ51_02590 [candidate division MSBL1 archaeon SCGC-AAA382A20]|uniref:Transcription regulator AsnC/Lrp ligand binding domain-containing protein n=1 Tax=candidate division MSBL1 archaeon SCGC-AAA382A20 TaxID=1698280 RepID=A0A133VKB3_9EURY|nr:hypothetical protein AKJ51_02590 [candidate division MSBL1 archaeon SCGC-AAA382A20]